MRLFRQRIGKPCGVCEGLFVRAVVSGLRVASAEAEVGRAEPNSTHPQAGLIRHRSRGRRDSQVPHIHV